MNAKFSAETLFKFGNTRLSLLDATPNHMASVGTYGSTEVVGTHKSLSVSSGQSKNLSGKFATHCLPFYGSADDHMIATSGMVRPAPIGSEIAVEIAGSKRGDIFAPTRLDSGVVARGHRIRSFAQQFLLAI